MIVPSLQQLADALACGRTSCVCNKPINNGHLQRHCPAHSDSNPSLSVTEQHDKLLLHCHAGCSQDAVLGVLRDKGLWPPPGNGHRSQVSSVTSYEVKNVDGMLVAFHVREDTTAGKRMWWEQSDGSTGLCGMPVTELPLYASEHLADLPDGAEVVVVEGEKAATALQLQGIAVVGTVTGASSTPGDDSLRPLVRLTPLLWADNDAPGRDHMTRMAARLVDLECQSVKAIDWLDAPVKGDAANAVDQGVDVRGLIAAARPWTPDKVEILDEAQESEEARLHIIALQDVV
jgi:DNA repair protein RadA/Sms